VSSKNATHRNNVYKPNQKTSKNKRNLRAECRSCRTKKIIIFVNKFLFNFYLNQLKSYDEEKEGLVVVTKTNEIRLVGEQKNTINWAGQCLDDSREKKKKKKKKKVLRHLAKKNGKLLKFFGFFD
jgi:hypothetical protein